MRFRPTKGFAFLPQNFPKYPINSKKTLPFITKAKYTIAKTKTTHQKLPYKKTASLPTCSFLKPTFNKSKSIQKISQTTTNP